MKRYTYHKDHNVWYDDEGSSPPHDAVLYDHANMSLTNDELVKAIEWVHYRLKEASPAATWYPYLERHLSALLGVQAKRAELGKDGKL